MKKIKSILFKIYRFFKYRIYPLENFKDSPDYFRIYRSFESCLEMQRFPGGWIYKGRKYPDYLFVGGASYAIFHKASEMLKGYGIDIGAGYWKLPGSISVDPYRGKIRRNLSGFKEESLDYIFSSHCLEHILNWKDELRKWLKLLKRNGRLFLYLPHPKCMIWRPGAPGIGEGHKWIPKPEVIKQSLQKLGCKVINFDDNPDAMQSFYICVAKKSQN